MTNLFQLRNKLSNRILTPSQQINTKGRGRDNMEKDISYAPATPTTPSTPSPSSSPTTTQRGRSLIQRGNPSGPPQFGSGGPGSFTPII